MLLVCDHPPTPPHSRGLCFCHTGTNRLDLTPEWVDPVAVARAVAARRAGYDAEQTRLYVGRSLHAAERDAVDSEVLRLRGLDGPVPVNWNLTIRPEFPVAVPAPREEAAS